MGFRKVGEQASRNSNGKDKGKCGELSLYIPTLRGKATKDGASEHLWWLDRATSNGKNREATGKADPRLRRRMTISVEVIAISVGMFHVEHWAQSTGFAS